MIQKYKFSDGGAQTRTTQVVVLKMNRQEIDDLFDQAPKMFNSNRKKLDEDVVCLQEWLETQTHLPKLLGVHALRNFLILNKCSVEVAKQKIENYYIIRSKVPDLAYAINPKLPYYKALNETIYLVQHPQLTDELFTVTFVKVKGEILPESYELISFLKKFWTMVELSLREGVMCRDVIVCDARGIPLSIALKITPVLIRKSLFIYQETVSARLKAIHMINVATPLVKVLHTLKTFIKPKLFEQIHIHSEPDSLKKFLRLDLLPVDFGGQGLSLQALEDALEAKYAKYQGLFDSLDEIEVDETLRPAKLEDDEFLGYYGNFKKLEID